LHLVLVLTLVVVVEEVTVKVVVEEVVGVALAFLEKKRLKPDLYILRRMYTTNKASITNRSTQTANPI
jgi:hypothetical protein